MRNSVNGVAQVMRMLHFVRRCPVRSMREMQTGGFPGLSSVLSGLISGVDPSSPGGEGSCTMPLTLLARTFVAELCFHFLPHVVVGSISHLGMDVCPETMYEPRE
jgi:hypothetical protein